MPRHLITLDDLTAEQVSEVFALSGELKRRLAAGSRPPLLAGRTLALLFEKQSLRTRVSFEAGMAHLGGNSIMLGEDAGFGSRESVPDFARVLTGMADVVVLRAKSHATVETFAHYAKCPVINGLTNEAHPCQVLADLFTLYERRGPLAGRKIAWVGDGNNVAQSLARGCSKLGVSLSVCTPSGYALNDKFVAALLRAQPKFDLTLTQDPLEAVRDSLAVYTDVWASMGQEGERQARQAAFADYQVNGRLMAAAPSDAVFMHCLPARRGEEVTDEVIDGPQSIVLPQSENRMHVQKGILAWILDVKIPK